MPDIKSLPTGGKTIVRNCTDQFSQSLTGYHLNAFRHVFHTQQENSKASQNVGNDMEGKEVSHLYSEYIGLKISLTKIHLVNPILSMEPVNSRVIPGGIMTIL